MQLVEILVLALASMIWPTLLAVVTVALTTPQPVKLLSSFLAGSLLTTTTVGVVVVFLLQGSSLFSGSHRTLDPAVYLAVGGAALFIAYRLRRGGSRSRAQPGATPKGPGWSERALARGAPIAFAVGIVLNVIPGVLPFVALKDIVELDYAAGTTVALIVGFYLVMFLPAEVPLVSYLVAPVKTEQTVGDLRGWISRNTRPLAVVVFTSIGIYLVVRGIVSLMSAL